MNLFQQALRRVRDRGAHAEVAKQGRPPMSDAEFDAKCDAVERMLAKRSAPAGGGHALVEVARSRGVAMRKAMNASPHASPAPASVPATGGKALVAAARRRAAEMRDGHGAALALRKRLDATDAEHRAAASEGRGRAMEALRRARPHVEKRDAAGGGVAIEVPIAKRDAERRLVSGWANVIEVGGVPVVDRQGDVISLEELEAAAHAFVRDHRVGKLMHSGPPVLEVVESVIVSPASAKAMGMETDRTGWWITARVTDDGAWARVKAGELRSFSIGGSAVRVEGR